MASTLFQPIEATLHGRPNTTATATMSAVPTRDPSNPMFGAPCGVCIFPLPFRLLLIDRVWLAARLQGQPLMIKVTNKTQPSFDRRTGVDAVEGLELSNDRRGIVTYSEVEIHFPYSLLLSTGVQELLGIPSIQEPALLTTAWLDSLHDTIERVAIFAVNRLLKVYRLFSAEHFVRPVTRGELFTVFRGWLMPGVASPFSIAWGAPQHALQPEALPLSAEFHTKLASWLAEERDVPVWVELVQDAKEHLEVGRYRHAVIDCRTALEVYLDQTLLNIFRVRGVNAAEAALEMGISRRRAERISSLEDAIAMARINDKLKKGLNACLGLRLGKRAIWSRWLRAKQIRELGAHYGASIPEDDANHCVVTVEALMDIMHRAGSPVSAFVDSMSAPHSHLLVMPHKSRLPK